ncbi:MAG: flagellar biosynthesis protein FlhF [Alicyclobacillus sp.]|nr:flagellar biosynthesis protein FlhF [Alicyclobacillus sp.]
MMIRRYIVKEIPEAVVMIRRELGKDAVILNTRKVWVKQWFGLWRTRRIEVVAATGDDVPRRAPAGLASAEPKVDKPTPTRTPQQRVDRLSSIAADEVQQLWNEIAQLKRYIDATGRLRTVQQWMDRLREHLAAQQVHPTYIEVLLEAMQRIQESQPNGTPLAVQPFDQVRQTFIRAVQDALGPLRDAKELGSETRVVAFVGPTGVGKTTTIAKLAAQHVLKGDRKVGLITTDTFRIAAVDQLRTYANILSVPLQVAYEPSELPEALAALSDCDLVLVDTTGRNFAKEAALEDLRRLLSAVPFDEVHLVVSLTAKADDIDVLATGFAELPVTHVVLTKIDETRTYGAFLNLLMKLGRPLSYMTMGQNVPDDIAVASVERLLKLTTGGAAS